MFFLIYLRRELTRRTRQTVAIALGLAVGVGLVITVSAATEGVRKAQATVLHSLYGIGTDITVTTAPPAGRPGSGSAAQGHDVLGLPQGLGVLDAGSVASVAGLRGVSGAAGGLTLTDTDLTRLPAPASFTVTGLDLKQVGLGPYASGTIASGRSLNPSDAASNVTVVDSAYATTANLSVGSSVRIAGKSFQVVGITRQPQNGGASDVYIPLERAQSLARFQDLPDLRGHIDIIYVKAASGSVITSVQDEIKKLLPSATVTSSENLANAVNGSLANATSLATSLGKWLAIASLATAFAIASLLTMSTVSRRVRELGTLKALGWRSKRIVTQLIGESLVTGALGAALGIVLGYAGAKLIRVLAPALTATVASNPGSKDASGSTHTVAIHLTAPVTLTVLLLAAALAITGGLIAGSLAGWRAARLSPAEALRRVV